MAPSHTPSRAWSGTVKPSCSIGSGSGASWRRITSSRDMRAAASCASSASRRLDGFIPPAFSAR